MTKVFVWITYGKKCSPRKITVEISVAKMVKCALALCHLNADVERSVSVNKEMLMEQNVSMKDEPIIGLRATKAAVQDYGGVQNVPITLDMIKVVEKSHYLYTEHLRQEAAKKSTEEREKAKADAQRRKIKEKKVEESYR